MKTLITWLGFMEDFTSGGASTQVDPSNFTGTIHKDIIPAYNFDKHIIIITKDSSDQITSELKKKCHIMTQFLTDIYPKHKVEFMEVDIDKSELQNFPVIESKLRSFLQSFSADDELHVVAGTGPTAVSMTWSSLWIAMKDRFNLYVMQRAEYTKGAQKTELMEINPYISPWLDNKLREYHFNQALPENIYQDDMVKSEYEKATNAAYAADINVLILGETGCGKDKMANFIVKQSPLSAKMFKEINCASLPDELLYSELFGHVKGAFTGAEKDRTGLFQECNGGTLFLDEIGDISLFMQQSLLRAIENGHIKKAGNNEIIKNIRVRIIAATNNNLYEKCKKGEFRWDLYYRLCTMEIELEPYRSRTSNERKKIIQHYLSIAEIKWGKNLSLSPKALEIFERYSFPGNFREIYNTINGLFAAGVEVVLEKDLPKRFFDQTVEIDEKYDTALRKHCEAVYKKYNYDFIETYKALGYGNSKQVKDKFEKWGIKIHK